MISVKFEDAGPGFARGLRLARVLGWYRSGVMPRVAVIAGSSPVVPTRTESKGMKRKVLIHRGSSNFLKKCMKYLSNKVHTCNDTKEI